MGDKDQDREKSDQRIRDAYEAYRKAIEEKNSRSGDK